MLSILSVHPFYIASIITEAENWSKQFSFPGGKRPSIHCLFLNDSFSGFATIEPLMKPEAFLFSYLRRFGMMTQERKKVRKYHHRHHLLPSPSLSLCVSSLRIYLFLFFLSISIRRKFILQQPAKMFPSAECLFSKVRKIYHKQTKKEAPFTLLL